MFYKSQAFVCTNGEALVLVSFVDCYPLGLAQLNSSFLNHTINLLWMKQWPEVFTGLWFWEAAIPTTQSHGGMRKPVQKEMRWSTEKCYESLSILIWAKIFSAGPSLMFMVLMRWSSFRRSRAWPSISWERNSSAISWHPGKHKQYIWYL